MLRDQIKDYNEKVRKNHKPVVSKAKQQEMQEIIWKSLHPAPTFQERLQAPWVTDDIQSPLKKFVQGKEASSVDDTDIEITQSQKKGRESRNRSKKILSKKALKEERKPVVKPLKKPIKNDNQGDVTKSSVNGGESQRQSGRDHQSKSDDSHGDVLSGKEHRDRSKKKSNGDESQRQSGRNHQSKSDSKSARKSRRKDSSRSTKSSITVSTTPTPPSVVESLDEVRLQSQRSRKQLESMGFLDEDVASVNQKIIDGDEMISTLNDELT
ncbi:hypothetical protein GEMRC1_004811 [Eukaryota sp. GEM-RC1]